jgi:hypothetical protein
VAAERRPLRAGYRNTYSQPPCHASNPISNTTVEYHKHRTLQSPSPAAISAARREPATTRRHASSFQPVTPPGANLGLTQSPSRLDPSPNLTPSHSPPRRACLACIASQFIPIATLFGFPLLFSTSVSSRAGCLCSTFQTLCLVDLP